MEWAWWAIKDLNLGPLACEASALTTELIAHEPRFVCNRTAWDFQPYDHRHGKPDRAVAEFDRARYSRQGRSHPPLHRGAAGQRPLADRRRTRRGQNDAGAGAGELLPLLVPTHPIYFGPAPFRRGWHQHIQPDRAAIRF